MFNFQLTNFNSLCRGTFFLNHVVGHDYYRPKLEVPVATPFTDDEGNTLYGYEIPNEDDILFKRQESIRCSISRTKKNIRRVAYSGKWKYFCTFTFSMLEVGNRYDYSNVSMYMQKFLRLVQSKTENLQYLVVPELHSDGAIHFHGLFSAELPVEYAGVFVKTGATYHVKDYVYGFSTAMIVQSDARIANYILKYITKDLIAVSKCKRRYWWSTSTIEIPESMEFLLKKKMIFELLNFIETECGGVCYDSENSGIKTRVVMYSPVFSDLVLERLCMLGFSSIDCSGSGSVGVG